MLVSPLVKMSCWPVCKGGSSVLKQVWLIISLGNIYSRKQIFVQNLLVQECYESLDCIIMVTRYIYTSYARYPRQPFNVSFFWSPYWLKFYPVMKPNVQMAVWPVAVVVTCYECVHGKLSSGYLILWVLYCRCWSVHWSKWVADPFAREEAQCWNRYD